MPPNEGDDRSIKTEPSLCRVNQVSHKPAPLQSPHQPQVYQNAATTVLRPPIGQFVINTLLQAAAFAAAIAFGVFAIKSVNKADTANYYAAQALEEARIANQIAMIVLCTSQVRLLDVSSPCVQCETEDSDRMSLQMHFAIVS